MGGAASDWSCHSTQGDHSGKSKLTVATRLACNRFLADAVQQWAFNQPHQVGWPRESYDAKIAVGNNHHKALRALGKRWLEILWYLGKIFGMVVVTPITAERMATMSTEDILNHHLQAFSAGDAEEAAKDYDDQSVLITQDGQFVGRAAIKEVMTGLFSGLFKPGTCEFTLDKTEIAGDVAFIAWHADTASHEIPLGTDTYLVRDGKIAAQTFAAQMNPK